MSEWHKSGIYCIEDHFWFRMGSWKSFQKITNFKLLQLKITEQPVNDLVSEKFYLSPLQVEWLYSSSWAGLPCV